MKNVYSVGSSELTFELIEQVLSENIKLKLHPDAVQRIQKCRDYLDEKIKESDVPVYGITTGFGSLCDKSISLDQLSTLQENLVKSHACSVGKEVPREVVKLMLFFKAHALSLGHSGVQVLTVERIIDFFNNDILPIVYDRGSLGASGDLAPLANLFLPLIGEGEVYYKGEKKCSKEVLKEMGWEPVELQSKEGLALLNGTQFMSANGTYAILRAFRLAKISDLLGALSLEGFDGTTCCGQCFSSWPAASRTAGSKCASRIKSATLNCSKPVCRVPSISPGPRSSKSFSAIIKPSLVSRIIAKRSRPICDNGAW